MPITEQYLCWLVHTLTEDCTDPGAQITNATQTVEDGFKVYTTVSYTCTKGSFVSAGKCFTFHVSNLMCKISEMTHFTPLLHPMYARKGEGDNTK